MAKNITARDADYSKWYNDIVQQADLAENSGVRGCMVIKPYGYAIWEKMQAALDKKFKDTGHVNAYFPLFIPKSYFSKEASHVDGFAKECAVVTHYRLKNADDGKGIVVDEDAKLEEEQLRVVERAAGELFALVFGVSSLRPFLQIRAGALWPSPRPGGAARPP